MQANKPYKKSKQKLVYICKNSTLQTVDGDFIRVIKCEISANVYIRISCSSALV